MHVHVHVCINVCMNVCVCVCTKLHSNQLYPWPLVCIRSGHMYTHNCSECNIIMLTPVFCDHAQAHDYAELGVAIKSLPLQQLQ